jgi:7,8-dihydropterin-6-yl-methyl-4-(beta-D-ribofuranosyl)aminobenzene 5'-phosphate synthase
MIRNLRITLLSDNFVAKEKLLAELGLCMLIEADGKRILFDAGQGFVALRNARALGLSLQGLDAVVLSHGHYDHTGGLADALDECGPVAVYIHPAAIAPKFNKGKQPSPRSIGMPAGSREALTRPGIRVVWTSDPTEIVPGVWCTGEIPRFTKDVQSVAGFFLDEACSVPDLVADDQAIYVEHEAGLVVISGCSHSGAENVVEQACRLSGQETLYALIGGLHLGGAAASRLDTFGDALDRRGCRLLAPCHCTGSSAHAYLRSRFGARVRDVGVGEQILLEGRGR